MRLETKNVCIFGNSSVTSHRNTSPVEHAGALSGNRRITYYICADSGACMTVSHPELDLLNNENNSRRCSA